MNANEDMAIAHAEIKAESKEQRARRAWFLVEDEEDTEAKIEAIRERKRNIEKNLAEIKRLLEGCNNG